MNQVLPFTIVFLLPQNRAMSELLEETVDDGGTANDIDSLLSNDSTSPSAVGVKRKVRPRQEIHDDNKAELAKQEAIPLGSLSTYRKGRVAKRNASLKIKINAFSSF